MALVPWMKIHKRPKTPKTYSLGDIARRFTVFFCTQFFAQTRQEQNRYEEKKKNKTMHDLINSDIFYDGIKQPDSICI